MMETVRGASLLLLQHRAFPADVGPFITSADSYVSADVLFSFFAIILFQQSNSDRNRFRSCLNCSTDLLQHLTP